MALRAFIVASLLAVAGLCRAQGVAYTAGEPSTVDNSQMIYRVDLATRSATPVGSAGLYNNDSANPILLLSGLTFGVDQKLYAVALPSTAQQPLLVTISLQSGRASVVAPISGLTGSPPASSLSLAFGCDGRLWMASSETNNLWGVNSTTGQVNFVGSLGTKLTSMAAQGSALYGFGGSGNANLYSIDVNSGSTHVIGAYGVSVPNPVDGAFDASGALWGLLRNYNDFNNSGLPLQLNSLAQINLTTGAMNVTGVIADPPRPNPSYKARMRGFAIAPPVCTDGGPPPAMSAFAAPALSPVGLGAFLVSMLGAALIAFRQRRRNEIS